MTKTIVVKLQAQMAAKVVALAKKRQTTKSEIVRQALERELNMDPLADLAHIIGAAQGPGDLSTNKKHMAGFGK